MSWSDAVLGMAVTDGLLAQRKLDGEKTIIAPDDPETLQAIVSQGKRAEGILRSNGNEAYIRGAYRRAGLECPYPSQ